MKTLTLTRKYPHPPRRVRVFTGKGKGSPETTPGLPEPITTHFHPHLPTIARVSPLPPFWHICAHVTHPFVSSASSRPHGSLHHYHHHNYNLLAPITMHTPTSHIGSSHINDNKQHCLCPRKCAYTAHFRGWYFFPTHHHSHCHPQTLKMGLHELGMLDFEDI